MKIEPAKMDMPVLSSLAEYRVLSVGQLTVLHFTSRQTARKTIRKLAAANLIEITHMTIRGLAGRPENVVFLGKRGVQVLRERGLIGPDVPADLLTRIDHRTLGHQLLTNWVRIGLNLVDHQKTSLAVKYLDPAASLDLFDRGKAGRGFGAGLIPDGVFSITDADQGKSLLFFIEVDMGTEVLASDRILTRDVRKKILGYQDLFRCGTYKRLERHAGASFQGFRTLFVANTRSRLDRLCRLVASMPSTGFIWVTEQSQLFSPGISGRIWVRGGDQDSELHSILGPSQTFECPIPLPK